MPEKFLVSLRVDRHRVTSAGENGGIEITGQSLPTEFSYFNRAWRAVRKMITADQNWDRIIVVMEKKKDEKQN